MWRRGQRSKDSGAHHLVIPGMSVGFMNSVYFSPTDACAVWITSTMPAPCFFFFSLPIAKNLVIFSYEKLLLMIKEGKANKECRKRKFIWHSFPFFSSSGARHPKKGKKSWQKNNPGIVVFIHEYYTSWQTKCTIMTAWSQWSHYAVNTIAKSWYHHSQKLFACKNAIKKLSFFSPQRTWLQT